jgi:hypothetical protein
MNLSIIYFLISRETGAQQSRVGKKEGPDFNPNSKVRTLLLLLTIRVIQSEHNHAVFSLVMLDFLRIYGGILVGKGGGEVI